MPKDLIKIYTLGYKHQLNGDIRNSYTDMVEMRAYNVGRLDAINGKVFTSLDSKAVENILTRIHKKDW
jgi:hypothetical protein